MFRNKPYIIYFSKGGKIFLYNWIKDNPLDEPFCDNLPFIIFVKDKIQTEKKEIKVEKNTEEERK